jgi:hypothetical protein
MLFWRRQIGWELSNPYQNGGDCESSQQQAGFPGAVRAVATENEGQKLRSIKVD